MQEFFETSAPLLSVWAIGVVILGAALAYGIVRTGRLSPSERTALDSATRMRQRPEDPQKRD